MRISDWSSDVCSSDLYELIHYAPTTKAVTTTPLVIFPPWINRFYILDLRPEKSFVKWAVDQGLSVFMVSWNSADGTMGDVTWDEYVAAQIDAIDTIQDRTSVVEGQSGCVRVAVGWRRIIKKKT